MSNKANRRIEHKSLRQRERQALRGDHRGEPRSMSWSGDGAEKDVPLITDRMPHRSKKKGCKRNKGGAHTPVYRTEPLRYEIGEDGFAHMVRNFTAWQKTGWFCDRCNKRLWGYVPKYQAPATKPPGHWDTVNINRRLYGDGLCGCGCDWGRDEGTN